MERASSQVGLTRLWPSARWSPPRRLPLSPFKLGRDSGAITVMNPSSATDLGRRHNQGGRRFLGAGGYSRDGGPEGGALGTLLDPNPCRLDPQTLAFRLSRSDVPVVQADLRTRAMTGTRREPGASPRDVALKVGVS